MSKKVPVIGCQFEGRIGSPIIEKVDAKLKLCPPEPITLAGAFSDTEIKLYEADFFLKFIDQNAFHHALILYGLSAFLTAARSITLFLQAECKGKPGFGEWYVNSRTLLQQNTFAKFLLKTRNLSAHEMYANITVIHEREAKLNKTKTAFEACDQTSIGFEFDTFQFTPGLKVCSEYLKLLEGIIAEPKKKNFLLVDPTHGHKVRFTVRCK